MTVHRSADTYLVLAKVSLDMNLGLGSTKILLVSPEMNLSFANHFLFCAFKGSSLM